MAEGTSAPCEKLATRIPVPSATIMLIAVNILAFCASLIYSAHLTGAGKFMDTRIGAQFDTQVLLGCGAAYGPKTLGGQYWRVVTSLFLHSNWWHLAGNMCCLFPIGVLLETWLRRQTLVAIYVITGIGGCLLGTYFHPTVINVGSSGAIFGLSGALISLMAFGKVSFPGFSKASVLLWASLATLFFLWLGQSSSHISSTDHLGGLLTGLFLGALLARAFRSETVQPNVRQWRPLAVATAIMVVLFPAVVLLRSEALEINRGELAFKNNDNVAAVAHFQKYLTKHPNDLLPRIQLGATYERMGKAEEAAVEYRRVLEIDPDNPYMQYQLANIYLLTQRADEAIPLLKKSVPKLPPDDKKYFNLAFTLMLSGQLEEAEQYARTAVTLDTKSSRNKELLEMILNRLAVTGQTSERGKPANKTKSAH